MEVLKINEKEIHSLEELRQNFDLNQVITAFLDCSLEKWLADCFYEKHADQVRSLDHAIAPDIDRELCRILGIDYVAAGYLSEEQRIVYEHKCRIIQQHSDDPIAALWNSMSSPISDTSPFRKSLPQTCGHSTAPYRKPGGYLPERGSLPVFPAERSMASTPPCTML